MFKCLLGVVLMLPLYAGSASPSVEGPPSTKESEQVLTGRAYDGSSGAPVFGAQIAVPALGIGALANEEGRFSLRGFPDGAAGFGIEISHPCFHTVRVKIDRLDSDTPLLIGLPFRQPRTPTPSQCFLYGER
tara:strand:- start:482 stop:877 length:396 start_codon:yes stop_codon:yes gene_type:complete